VITGAMLGVGRVIGDTAIVVVLLGGTLNLEGVGSTPLLSTLRGTGTTLTGYIFDNAPTGELNQPQKAYAAAFVLLVIVLAINAGVDIYSRRARRLRWT
jgi:phosphate transport system permease protein